MITCNNLLGGILVSLPILSVIVGLIIEHGWRTAIMILLSMVIVFSMLFSGVYLLVN